MAGIDAAMFIKVIPLCCPHAKFRSVIKGVSAHRFYAPGPQWPRLIAKIAEPYPAHAIAASIANYRSGAARYFPTRLAFKIFEEKIRFCSTHFHNQIIFSGQ